ncbi:hypothetical protein EGW08_008259 [Elysia chlorotica]|uniref:Uncharacterized protein n=1 Tax=Elysia chlorotica TaxID=188477 RepID=A0A433TR80_ELYCH|nr:hypothetical protein EGW08_008259 [Elysia chlorotica]
MSTGRTGEFAGLAQKSFYSSLALLWGLNDATGAIPGELARHFKNSCNSDSVWFWGPSDATGVIPGELVRAAQNSCNSNCTLFWGLSDDAVASLCMHRPLSGFAFWCLNLYAQYHVPESACTNTVTNRWSICPVYLQLTLVVKRQPRVNDFSAWMADFQPVMSHVMAGRVTGVEQHNHPPVYDEQTPLSVVESNRPRQIYGCGFSFEERLHRKVSLV